MARRIGYKGQLIIDTLKDLKRGDQVYITSWGSRYESTIVTRVRTVECATIITVKKSKAIKSVRFVGYHTSRIAVHDARTVLTLEKYWGELITETLEEADRRSRVIVERAEALKALRTLKDWLFDKEKDPCENEVE